MRRKPAAAAPGGAAYNPADERATTAWPVATVPSYPDDAAVPARQGGASGQARVLPHGGLLQTVLRRRTARAPLLDITLTARGASVAPIPWRECPTMRSAVSGEAGAARRIGRDLRADRRSGDRQGARRAGSHAWSRRAVTDAGLLDAKRGCCSSRCILSGSASASPHSASGGQLRLATWTPRTLPRARAHRSQRAAPSRRQRRCAARRVPARALPPWQFDAGAAARRGRAAGTRSRAWRRGRAARGAGSRRAPSLCAGPQQAASPACGRSSWSRPRIRRSRRRDAAQLEITETLRGEPAPTLLAARRLRDRGRGAARRWLSQPLRSAMLRLRGTRRSRACRLPPVRRRIAAG